MKDQFKLPAACPKCAAPAPWDGPRYVLPRNGYPGGIHKSEHLRFECMTCRYAIEHPCLDAEKTS